MKRYIGNSAKKTGCVISAVCMAFSVTGCLKFLKKAQSTKNYDAVMEAVKEGGFVEEWTKDVPEGMEVRYLVTKEMHVNSSDGYYEHLYKFDSYERCIYYAEVLENGYKQYENIYDADGNLTAKKQKHEGRINTSGPVFVDLECEYKYNAGGQMLSYEITSEYEDSEYILHYDNGGHLTGVTQGDKEEKVFDVNFDVEPYYETVAVLSAEADRIHPSYVIRHYDSEGRILSERDGEKTTTYQYENGVIVGSTMSNDSGYIAFYDADGNKLSYRFNEGKDSFESVEYQYNEHNDLIGYEEYGKDGLERRVTYTYEYDNKGNKTSKTTESWSIDSKGQETTSIITTTYTYDEHGLPVTEETRIGDGDFMEMSVYYYKAVLVYV